MGVVVGVEADVAVGGTGVFVLVAVAVAVGGTGVKVAVAVGGTGVAVATVPAGAGVVGVAVAAGASSSFIVNVMWLAASSLWLVNTTPVEGCCSTSSVSKPAAP